MPCPGEISGRPCRGDDALRDACDRLRSAELGVGRSASTRRSTAAQAWSASSPGLRY